MIQRDTIPNHTTGLCKLPEGKWHKIKIFKDTQENKYSFLEFELKALIEDCLHSDRVNSMQSPYSRILTMLAKAPCYWYN